MRFFISFFSVFIVVLLWQETAQAQRRYDIYWVSFTDKQNTPYSLFHPQEYLSPRALERRERYNIPIDSTDLPINPAYLEPINIKGFKIHSRSRWLNGVAVVVETASADIEDLKQFEFIKDVFPIGFRRRVDPATAIGERDYKTQYRQKDHFYGLGKNQITMLNGHYLHKMGFKGQSMHVAVIDGGFDGIRETPAFDSLFQRGQVLGTHDFVQGDDYVFESSTHGRNVLSCMAANMPYLFVGTAPEAQYYLFKTEDVKGEYLIEEYNWVAAVEKADRLGVDVINSSLGYYDFDDNDMDYGYVDLDGKTSAMTKAATLAANKGIFVVNSAGNEGNGKWKHITVPSDAENIMTVGAVDRDGFHAKFSSYGFEDRKYIKPNVVARGAIAVVAAKKRYDTSYSNGTSFSSPIMAGAVTSFWESMPHYSNLELLQAIENSANRNDEPNTTYGYGLPDFYAAYKSLSNSVIELTKEQTYYKEASNNTERLDIFMSQVPAFNAEVQLHNAQGELLFTDSSNLKELYARQLWYQTVPNWKELPKGIYYMTINLDGKTKRLLLSK
ncbi:MAG: S8 family serine peptidase [Aureispira sp.]